jgi:hypothetical protein
LRRDENKIPKFEFWTLPELPDTNFGILPPMQQERKTMKLKTHLKAGKTAQSAGQTLQNLWHSVEQKTAPLLGKTQHTLTSRKFWFWPF